MIVCDLCKSKVPAENEDGEYEAETTWRGHKLHLSLTVYPGGRRRRKNRFSQPSTHLCAKCAAGIAEKVFKKGVKPARRKK